MKKGKGLLWTCFKRLAFPVFRVNYLQASPVCSGTFFISHSVLHRVIERWSFHARFLYGKHTDFNYPVDRVDHFAEFIVFLVGSLPVDS